MNKLFVALMMFASFSGEGAEPWYVLNTADLCELHINGVEIMAARIYGEPKAIESFLKRQGFVSIKSCEWALNETLAPGSTRSSQAAYVVKRYAKPALPENYNIAANNTVLVMIEDPIAFLEVFRARPFAAIGSGGGGGNIPPKPPAGVAPPSEQEPDENSGCEVTGDFCLSTSGEASFSVVCGPTSAAITSSGAFNIGLSIQHEVSGEREN